jgi:hypothetical protein
VPYSDPEKRRSYGRQWMQRNADKARAAMRRWRQQHPDEHRAENRAYYARDPDRRQRQIESSPNRRAVRKAADARRRSRKLQSAGSYTYVEWLLLVTRFGGECAYCARIAALHADHRIPLAPRRIQLDREHRSGVRAMQPAKEHDDRSRVPRATRRGSKREAPYN